MNKKYLLEKAIEITKEYARGGKDVPVENALRAVYEMLKELTEDTER